MAKVDRTMVFRSLLLNLLLCSSWIQLSYSSKPIGVARKDDDISFKCQVCKKLAEKLLQQVKDKKEKIETKKMTKDDILEISDNVCELVKQEADLILKTDIVEQGDSLELVKQDTEGQCGSECKTIKLACQDFTKDYDTDVADYIYKHKPQLNTLVTYICEVLIEACSPKPPPVPKEKENKKMELMETMTKGITDASKATKKYANKMASRMKKWCKEKKASFTRQNSKSGKDEF